MLVFFNQLCCVLATVVVHMKGEWKCSTKTNGVQSAMMVGALKRPTLYADSWATPLHQGFGPMLTSVKDRARLRLQTSTVLAMNRALSNASIAVGLIKTRAVTARMVE